MRLRKKLGQHFLTDKEILRKEVEYARICSKDIVLEIGAGDGRLTELLAEKAKKVIAVEKDKRLARLLKEKFKDYNINIICADALHMQFPRFNKIVSNPPYGISTPLTFKFFNYKWETAVLSYQKEFAERLTAKPCERNYSRITVAVNYYCKPELLMTIPKEKFYPRPEVDSIIVRLVPRKKPFEADELFWCLIKKLFQHKKKLVKNALADAKFDKKIIQSVPKELLKKRVFCCTLKEFKKIAENLNKA